LYDDVFRTEEQRKRYEMAKVPPIVDVADMLQ
jgi:hypothetical protein